MRQRLVAVWAVFVVGGLIAGWQGLANLGTLSNLPPLPPVPTAVPLAPHPPLRDFSDEPPPFEAAGQAQPDATPPASPSGRLTILLMGIDQRPDEAAMEGGDPGRTDSLLLLSVDFDAQTAVMVSIPRDGFVVIPGHGNERVNAAYTFGELDRRGDGPALAKQTVSQLFGLPVDRYVLVDIHSTEHLIDQIGGVWIDSPTHLVDDDYPTDDYGTMTIDIPAGRQLMDGQTAVEYARTRHPDSDYGRQARQQQVLLAIRDRALQPDILPKLPSLIPDMTSLVKTDLTPVELLQLINFGRGLTRNDIVAQPPSGNLTPSYEGPGGAAYVNLTPDYRVAVRGLVTNPRIAAERAQVTVLNAGAPVGTGGLVSDMLTRSGLDVVKVTTAPTETVSRVDAGSSVRKSAETIVQTLQLPADALQVTDDPGTDIRVVLGPDVRLPSQHN
ncbi:MAG: LCP family protein [Chloroflexi bacterium]|nr:LCP family protein [Chloroflexota bacterium]